MRSANECAIKAVSWTRAPQKQWHQNPDDLDANAKPHKPRAFHATSQLWQGPSPQNLTERIIHEQRWGAECSHRTNDGDRVQTTQLPNGYSWRVLNAPTVQAMTTDKGSKRHNCHMIAR